MEAFCGDGNGGGTGVFGYPREEGNGTVGNMDMVRGYDPCFLLNTMLDVSGRGQSM